MSKAPLALRVVAHQYLLTEESASVQAVYTVPLYVNGNTHVPPFCVLVADWAVVVLGVVGLVTPLDLAVADVLLAAVVVTVVCDVFAGATVVVSVDFAVGCVGAPAVHVDLRM